MKKKPFLIFLMFLISGALLYFVYRKIGVKEIWSSFLSFSPQGIFWIFGLLILSQVIGILRWRIILKDRQCKFKFRELILPWLAGVGVTYFTPFAFMVSETTRTYALKQKKDISWSKGLSSVVIEKVFEGTTSFLLVTAGILFLIFHSLILSMKLPMRAWIFFSSLLLPIGAIIFFYIKAFRSESMARIIEKPLKKLLNHKVKSVFLVEKEIFEFFNIKNKNMLYSILLSLLRQMIDFLRFWAIILFLGINISIFQSISIISFIYLSLYIVPLPAALGVLEAVEAVVFSRFGLSPNTAIAFVLLLRAFDMILALFGLLFTSRVIWRGFKERLLEVEEENNYFDS